MDRIIDFLKEPELEKYSGDDVALTSSSSCASSSSSDEIVGFDTAKFMYLGSAGSMEQGSTEKPSSASSTTTAASASSAESLTNGPSFVLRDLNVQFPSGKLSVICGQTGAGKTSVVLALLGELKRIYGSTMLPDPRLEALSPTDPTTGLTRRGVAYVAQTAWMLNATVRDNILFGRPFDAERYWKVIDACALTRDLETLDAGDMTEVKT